MVIGGELVRERIVLQTLLAKLRRFQPVGELNQILLAGLRGDRFMITDAQKNRNRAERSELISNEVVPGCRFVIDDIERRDNVLQLVLHVFVEFENCAKIAEMPIKA